MASSFFFANFPYHIMKIKKGDGLMLKRLYAWYFKWSIKWTMKLLASGKKGIATVALIILASDIITIWVFIKLVKCLF